MQKPRRPRRPKGEKIPDEQLLPFIRKIISVHKDGQTLRTKRVQCVVRLLGITKTMHLTVPVDFTV